jgi:hypothetical protein
MNETYQGAAPRDPKPYTSFDLASETFGAAHRLSDRVIALVNRIAGHLPPESEGKAGPTAIANGILDELRENARSAQSNIARANEALDRLENQI